LVEEEPEAEEAEGDFLHAALLKSLEELPLPAPVHRGGQRPGDNAPLVLLELVDWPEIPRDERKGKDKKAAKR
jgi:hypothetical protein